MIKFGLKIRTRSGLPVDNLVVHTRDQAEAERKITQMYMHCEIIESSRFRPQQGTTQPISMESFRSSPGRETREKPERGAIGHVRPQFRASIKPESTSSFSSAS